MIIRPSQMLLPLKSESSPASRTKELPRMPPLFDYCGSWKLYQALAGILRLLGSSLITDSRNEGFSCGFFIHLLDMLPLGYVVLNYIFLLFGFPDLSSNQGCDASIF